MPAIADSRYRNIQMKLAQKQPISADDQAFAQAYQKEKAPVPVFAPNAAYAPASNASPAFDPNADYQPANVPTSSTVTLPPGYENAQPVGVSLPPGYEDAMPVSSQAAPSGPSFLEEAGHLLAGQALGMMGAPASAFQEYQAARQRGESVSSALGRAAFHLIPGGDAALNGIETALGYRDRRAAGYGPVYSAVAPIAAPAVGVNLPEMERQAAAGNTPGVLAGAAVPATEVVASMGSRALPAPDVASMRATAATAVTTPKGTLTPSAAAAARFGGAFAGGAAGLATGHPIIGAVEGYRAGPSLLKAVVGERPPLSDDQAFQQAVAKGVRQANIRQAVKDRVTAQYPPTQTASPTPEPSLPDPEVLRVPEPNSPTPGVRSGAAFSIPRDQLIPLAMSGNEGALNVLRSLGKPVVIEPRGTGYPGPRRAISTLPSAIDSYSELPEERAAD